jgi:hypothetical protein
LSSILTPKSEEQMLKELFAKELPKEVQVMMERQTFKFDVAHTMLLDKFEINIPESKSFRKVCSFIRAELSDEEMIAMKAVVKGEPGRRQAFNLMMQMHEITPSMLNNCFPLGEKRNQFEQWLDGKINQLP